MDFEELQKKDPIKRMVEKQNDRKEWSPMDPPDAYEPPAQENVNKEQMHPFLQSLLDEHEPMITSLAAFEAALVSLREEGLTKAVNEKIKAFFEFFDTAFISHNRKEEQQLFPLLRKRLLAHGEHSQGPEKTTAVDVLEDDHVKTLQQLAIIFNFFALVFRLPDETSQMLVMDTALQQGKLLVEDVRLHIFREENIIFPLAHQYISQEEFDALD